MSFTAFVTAVAAFMAVLIPALGIVVYANVHRYDDAFGGRDADAG